MPEGERRHVQEDDVLDLAGQDGGLDGRAHRDDLVRVHALVGLPAEQVSHQLLDLGHPGLAADQDHLVDLLRGDSGVLHRLPAGLGRPVDEIHDEGLELGSRQRHDEMLRPGRVRRDEGQVDLGLERARQLDLGLLGRLLEALEGHPVLAEIDAVLLPELLGDPLHDLLVEVVAAQMCVAVRGLDLEDALADLEDRDVEGAAAEVVDRDRLVLLLVEPVRERGRGRLVHDPEDLQAGDGARVLGRLPLAVVEVGGDRDDRLRDLLAQVGLGGLLELPQDHGGDLGRGVLLAADLDARVAVRGLHDLVGHELDLVEHLVVPATHEALDREDGVLGVRDGLALGDLADQDLPFLGEADDGRRETVALRVGDDDRVAPLHDGHDRVGGSEIDADHLGHCLLSP